MAASSSVLGKVKRSRRLLWKFPCSVCCKPVKCNRKGLFCDLCNRWCYSRCSDVSDIQYACLSALGPESPWYCQACTIQQLPFADCSFVSDTVSSISDVSCDEEDHPLLCNSTVVFCHINICSLMPVFDKLTTFWSIFSILLFWELQRHDLAQQFLLVRYLFQDIHFTDVIVIQDVVVFWFM